MPYLKFISDKNLISAVSKVINVIEKAEQDAEVNIHKNVIDPFSALFHGITKSIPYTDWMEQEKARQTQKTMQNSIGDFHQDILGSISGWKNLGTGGGLDVINKKMKIIAEVKNKYNTTKGNHLVKLYDDIKNTLKNYEYTGYTGYYVEVISKRRKKYDKPFTPSEKGKRRPAKNKIRVIDGVNFYEMATGRKNALLELFDIIPQVIADKHNYKLNKQESKEYHKLFKMAFSTE
ncbi:MAG: Eco47II family restriction endonuclease [Candidatus Magasanikbacteria bacterium CG_4_10_14_0_8_um_filter_32_14]|uniref:Eco47II family restriction endonuclease n=1 Tax=Candidatus Magasanikbacteria bacterium CG_4_10_14_0_8_um_filter_32_14 TaxID=1974640 RepID=A0A2M7RA98_9BACT|nr:MAG: Eco47II family restriction endonuclease [Candidatus Magasanikbacteria bacterium CG_4_10_14_0_8_um_filter_32_14]